MMSKAEKDRAYYEANRERIKARTNAYYHANKEAAAAKQRERYQANTEKIRAANRAWAEQNREKMNAYHQDYVKRNRGKWSAQTAAYRAKKKTATPAWADDFAIECVYKYAAALRAIGLDVHVDHIVPLQSESVCGLHVESNLQVMPATPNRKKSNRHWPDMP